MLPALNSGAASNASRKRQRSPELETRHPRPVTSPAGFQSSAPSRPLPTDGLLFSNPKSQQLAHTILSALQQTTYGKNLEELLSPAKDFKAYNFDGDVFLENYSEIPRPQPPFKGACNDLCYSFGRFLKELIGRHSHIKVGKGTCQDYFPNGTHYFLLAWPKVLNESIIQEIDEKKIPEMSLLVDPSFHKMLMPSHKAERNRYRLETVHDLEDLSPENISNLFMLPVELPIGFVRDIIPAFVENYGPEALLYLSLEKPSEPGGVPGVKFISQRTPATLRDAQESADLIPLLLHPENLVSRFYEKVSTDLADSTALSNLDLLEDGNDLDDLAALLELPAAQAQGQHDVAGLATLNPANSISWGNLSALLDLPSLSAKEWLDNPFSGLPFPSPNASPRRSESPASFNGNDFARASQKAVPSPK